MGEAEAQATNAPVKFLRDNKGKLRYSLIDFKQWEEIVSYRNHMKDDYEGEDGLNELYTDIILVTTNILFYPESIMENLLQLKLLAYKLALLQSNYITNDSITLDLLVFEPLVKVMEYGATKYTIHNWRNKSDDIFHVLDCILRHILELQKGNLEDDESNAPHVGHIMANVMFLSYHLNK